MSESIIAVLCLAAACWLLRVTFVLVPAEKLPAAVRRSLDQMAPAVLAALATVEITEKRVAFCRERHTLSSPPYSGINPNDDAGQS